MYEELTFNCLECERQKKIEVYHKDKLVGDYYADIFVANKVILELKAAESVCEEHEYQLINYLKATKIELGLLLNFSKKPEIKRKIFTHDLKKNVKICLICVISVPYFLRRVTK